MLKNVLENTCGQKKKKLLKHDIHLIYLYKNKEDLTGVTSFNQQVNWINT